MAHVEAVTAARWRPALIIAMCQSSQSLVLGGIALFLPLIREDFGLSFAAAGSLAACSSVAYAFMQVPSGFMADRFGPRRLFMVGLAGTSALMLAFALIHEYQLLLINQTVTGVFRALMFAPGLLLMTSVFPPQRRATAMGVFVAGGFSSNIVLSLVGPALVGPLGWRTLFVTFALFGGAMLVVFWRRGPQATSRANVVPPRWHDVSRLLRHRVMWLLGVIQFVRLAVVLGIATWLPTLVVQDEGYSLAAAGLLVALGAAITAPANILGGYVSDRLGRPLLVIGVSLVVLGLTTTMLAHVNGTVALVTVVAVNALFVQLYFGPLFAVAIEMLGSDTAGLTSGMGNLFANLGGFTAVYALGAFRDATGSFTLGLYLLGGACAAAALCTLALSRTRRRVSAHPVAPRM